MFREMAHRYEHLVMQQALLREIDELKALTEDTAGLCKEIVRALSDSVPVENCSIMLFDEDRQYLELQAGASPLDGFGAPASFQPAAGARLRGGEGIAGKVAQTGEPTLVDDIRREPAFKSLAHKNVDIRSLFCLPLKAEQEVLGVLNISHPTPGFFEPGLKKEVELAAERIASVLTRHRLFNKLRESETRYRLLTEHAADGIVIFDLKGGVLAANPAAERLAGCTAADLTAGTARWEEHIHPEDRAAFQAFQHAAQNARETRTIHYRMLHPAAGERFLEHISAPMILDSGQCVALVADIRDYTRHQQAEEALRQSEEKFRTLSESTSAATFIYQGSEIKYVNPAAVRISGFTKDELLKLSFWDFIHPDFRELVRNRGFARQRGEDAPSRYELKIVTKSGEERWVDFSAGRFLYEHRTAVLGIVFDITERKRTEEALGQFKFVVDHASEEFYLVNPDGALAYVNEAAAKSLGYTIEELLALGIPGIDSVYDKERYPVHFQQVKQGHLPSFEVTHVAKDGRHVIKEVQVFYLNVGEREYICGFGRDITQRKKVEEQLRLDEFRANALLELNQKSGLTTGEIANYAVEVGVKLTGSEIGYIAFVERNESILHMQHWSRAALEQCSVKGAPTLFRTEETGLWGEAVRQRRPIITNDYAAANSLKKGVPPGHVPLRRHMNVPVFDEGTIVALAGVGNKDTDYTDEEVRQLSLLMDGMWRIVCQKRAEEALRRRDMILESVAEVAGRFLKSMSWKEDAQDVLRRLGEATGVSGVYVFSNPIHQDNLWLTEHFYEWSAPANRRPPGNSRSLAIHVAPGGGLSRWGRLLGQGRPIVGRANEFPSDEQALLAAQGISSIAMAPIAIGNEWWGALVFEESAEPKEWSSAEISAIRAAADTFAAAIERQRTERLITEQRLKMVASSRLSSLGVMASGVAHEINNPLAIISLGAEQLLRFCAKEDALPMHDTAVKIQRNVVRIEKIVRGLRILSRDGSEEPFQEKPIKEVLEETLEMCRSRFDARKIEFTVNNAAPETIIECRPTLLSQVMMNLLNNAYDAVESLADKWVRIDIAQTEDRIELAVTDSGPGIPEKIRDHIMEPFFTTKEIGKGTGLGLSISKAVVESHNGELSLDTACDNTRFVVALPRRQSPES